MLLTRILWEDMQFDVTIMIFMGDMNAINNVIRFKTVRLNSKMTADMANMADI